MKLNCPSRKFTALLVGASLLAATGAVVLTVRAGDQTSKAKPIGLVVDDQPLAKDNKLNLSFAPVVNKVLPSVVKVQITIPGREESAPMLPDDPFFRQFFGNQLFGGRQKMMTPPEKGVGSGVIVTKDGYILTNNHVVKDASEVKVTLDNGKEYKAKVVGRDPASDLAVIKIDAQDLPAVTIADSSLCQVGDVVLAVGNPFAVGKSVTMGIISAKGRASLDLDYQDFIQTDAAINPGNSGGALVDTEGRLIGINTAIYSHSGGNQGVGFAIPTDLARGVMVALIEHGKIEHGRLGVHIQDVTPLLAKEFSLKNEKGALVSDVEPGSPADKAGIKSGDVILKFNGHDVADSRHLKLDVGYATPGERVSLEVMRDGSLKTLEIKVGEWHVAGEVASASENADDSDALHGVAVADLDAQSRQQLNIPDNVKGAIVTQVDANSASAEAGLKVGDVITEINHHTVANANDAVRLTEHSKNKMTLLHVWSKDGVEYLVVDESKSS
jgi:serine protease Do